LAVLVLLGVIGGGMTLAGLQLWAGWHERKARQQMKCFKFDAAYHHYQQSLRVWGSRADVQLGAARTARRSGNLEAAKGHLDACQKLKGTSPELQLERLLLQTQSGELSHLDDLKGYLEKGTEEGALVQEVLAEVFIRQKLWEDAGKVLDRLLQRDPNHVVALYLDGLLRRNMNNFPQATKLMKRVLALQPQHSGARTELWMLLLDEDPAAALEQVQYQLERNPTDSTLRSRLAETQMRLGKAADAGRILNELLDEQPENSNYLFARGTLALQVSDFVGAEGWLRKSLAHNPFNEEANIQLAEALFQQKNRQDEAEKQLAFCRRLSADVKRFEDIQAMSLDKLESSPALLHECGAILMRYGKGEQALKWLYKALEVDQQRQETHRLLADYFDRTGEKERADMHRRFIKKPEGSRR
jgi:predicted Zn-dependent protease